MSERQKLALVTGGSGFVGSHLTEGLVANGWRVRIFDARHPEDDWFAGLDPARVDVVTGDLRDAAALEQAAAGVDVVFHQAAIASVQRSIEHPQETVEVNIGGTVNVLEAARKRHVRRVVVASSAAVYGDGPETPKIETLPVRPLSPYAVSKLAGEQLGAVYGHLHGLETVSLRYFNVYGPRQDPTSPYSGVISRFVDAIGKGDRVTIYGDGEQTRDFVYVGDVVEANMLAASAKGASGTAMNIGSGRATSLNVLLQQLQRLADRSVSVDRLPARPGDIRESVSDVRLAGEVLGFEPRVALEVGLRTVFEAQVASEQRAQRLSI